MAKYIPGKSYIGSSEVATDFDVTGPTTFSNTLTVGEDDTGYDVKFYGATSGINMMWDASSDRLELTDNAKINFGNSNDLSIYHTGSHSNILANGTGDLIITQDTVDQDIIFKCDDGSGGTETYFFLDGSASSGNPITIFPDLSGLYFGTGADCMFRHDGTDMTLENNAGDFIIACATNDKDIILKCDNASGGLTAYLTLDGSETRTNIHKDLQFTDSIKSKFGTSGDLEIYHDGSNSYIANKGAAGDLYVSNDHADKDVIFQCDDGSGGLATYFKLDGSSAGGGALYTQFPDNSNLTFGSSDDLGIKHDGTDSKITNSVGDIVIRNLADDKDIIFQSDDGSGGLATYLTLDGGDKTLIASVSLIPNLGVTKPVVAAATNVAAAVPGTIYNFSDADGAIITLPDSGAGAYIGATFEFFVSVTATSNAHKIVFTDTTNEKLYGQLHMVDTDTEDAQVTFAAQADDSFSAVSMNGTTTGIIGSKFRITNIAADIWSIEGNIHHTGSAATPFATS